MPPTEQFADLNFPIAGIDQSRGFESQSPRQMLNGDWGRSCREATNVRGFEAGSQRDRGGSRSGIEKYVLAPVVAGWIIQDLSYATFTDTNAQLGGSAMTQLSQSGRVVTVVAVSQGRVFYASAGATSWTEATNTTGDTPALNYTGIIFSTALNQDLWFADGTNYCYFDPATGTLNRWAATAGTLPRDDHNSAPRLIATWRGRMVLSGLIRDPQNWFMSRISEPTDFDYFPLTTVVDPAQAASGNNSPMGLVGDVITALIPYSDDVLVFGGDHTIYLMNGDPMDGGQIDRLTDEIGIAWGQAWCKDPYGSIYFLSNKCGIYTLVPGQQPQRISQQIEQYLQAIDTGFYGVRLAWNDRFQGLHVFVTYLPVAGATTHFFYEARTGAWFTDTFTNTDHNPLAVCEFDGNLPGDRVVLIGSWDGYIRAVSPTATDDDGTDIASSVVLGPLATKDLDSILVKDLQAVLGTSSGDVTYAVYTGATAEGALAAAPVATGTWSAGRNPNTFIRRSNHALYLKLSSSDYWSMERIRCRLVTQGRIAARRKN